MESRYCVLIAQGSVAHAKCDVTFESIDNRFVLVIVSLCGRSHMRLNTHLALIVL